MFASFLEKLSVLINEAQKAISAAPDNTIPLPLEGSGDAKPDAAAPAPLGQTAGDATKGPGVAGTADAAASARTAPLPTVEAVAEMFEHAALVEMVNKAPCASLKLIYDGGKTLQDAANARWAKGS